MIKGWLRLHRGIIAWAAGAVALMLVALCVTGYAALRHFNNNLHQVNIAYLLGTQPADLHPGAENILLIGSNTRAGSDRQFGQLLPAVQAHTLMLVHISAGRKWAETMAIPPESWVSIPSCMTGDGRMSAPTQSRLDNAFAIGDMDGLHTALGAACTTKTVEQDTGIYVNHFIVMDFQGFKSMVAALGSVPVCNPTALDDPSYGIDLPAGRQQLGPAEALAYVRALFGGSDDSDLARVTRQTEFMSALLAQAKAEILDPLAEFRFVNAFTQSLTVDIQLGGVTGLYSIFSSLHGIPQSKLAVFTLPTYPRSEVMPADTDNALWAQPEDGEIFASLRNDVPVNSAIATASASRPGKSGVSIPAINIPVSTAGQTSCSG